MQFGQEEEVPGHPGNKHPGMKDKAVNLLSLVGWSRKHKRKHNQTQPRAVDGAWLRISFGDVGTMESS